MELRKSYAQLEPVKKKKSTNKGFVIITIMLKARRKTARTQNKVVFVTIAEEQNTSYNEEQVLKIYSTDDAKSLFQTVCEIITNKLNSDTIVKCIQFIACTCWISEGEKRKILRCHKSSKQKKNKKNSNGIEEILCSTRTSKEKKIYK